MTEYSAIYTVNPDFQTQNLDNQLLYNQYSETNNHIFMYMTPYDVHLFVITYGILFVGIALLFFLIYIGIKTKDINAILWVLGISPMFIIVTFLGLIDLYFIICIEPLEKVVTIKTKKIFCCKTKKK